MTIIIRHMKLVTVRKENGKVEKVLQASKPVDYSKEKRSPRTLTKPMRPK